MVENGEVNAGAIINKTETRNGGAHVISATKGYFPILFSCKWWLYPTWDYRWKYLAYENSVSIILRAMRIYGFMAVQVLAFTGHRRMLFSKSGFVAMAGKRRKGV